MAKTPNRGQKSIPLDQWKRFLANADRSDRRDAHKPPGALNPVYGHDLLVKTPPEGIPGRETDDETGEITIHSATCIVCQPAEESTPGEKIIIETDSEILVYNFDEEAAPGDAHLPTGQTDNGTRYLHTGGMAPLVAFELATRANTVDHFPQGAYLIDANGNRLTDATEPDIHALADVIRAHMTTATTGSFYLAWNGKSVIVEAVHLCYLQNDQHQSRTTVRL